MPCPAPNAAAVCVLASYCSTCGGISFAMRPGFFMQSGVCVLGVCSNFPSARHLIKMQFTGRIPSCCLALRWSRQGVAVLRSLANPNGLEYPALQTQHAAQDTGRALDDLEEERSLKPILLWSINPNRNGDVRVDSTQPRLCGLGQPRHVPTEPYLHTMEAHREFGTPAPTPP